MPTPAVFPALLIVGGIAAGVALPSLETAAAYGLAAAVAAAILAWRYASGPLTLAAIGLGFVLAGTLLGAADARRAMESPLRGFFDDATRGMTGDLPPLTIEGRLRADATPTPYGASLLMDVERVRTVCGWIPAAGGVRLAVGGSFTGARLEAWREGRRLRLPALLRRPAVYRNPGAPDEAFALARRGIALVGTVKSAALVEIIRNGRWPEEAAAAARAFGRGTIGAALPARPLQAGIVTAILIGDRGGLDPALSRRLQEAGTYHVIAISGGNIAILTGLAFLVMRVAGTPRRPGAMMLAVLICAYGYVAGGGPSVARATLAATVYLLATAADHRSPALNVFSTVALAAVISEPLEVFDPALLLSYGATLALLIAAGRLLAPPRPVVIGALVAVLVGTLCAEAALFPIGATVFHRVTVAGILLNFAAIPLMTAAQVGGLLTLAVSPLSDSLAVWPARAAGLAAQGLVESARLLDLAPWLSWRVPAPAFVLVATYYAGWAVWLLLPRAVRYRRAPLAASAAAAILIASPVPLTLPWRTAPRELRVTFLDVGQGDAVLLQFPAGHAMLVDAAGLPASTFDVGERVVTPAMLALGVRRLDYLAITHGDPDHVAGAASVATDFRPRELWEGVVVPPHALLRELRGIVARGAGTTRVARPGDRLRSGDVELHVLHPPEPDWERQRVRNDDSIVLEVRYGDVSILLPGDIGASIEESLIPRLSDAPLRILKAAHHGSAGSSGQAWLEAVRPAAVIFSCGRANRYGHPAPAVLARTQRVGAEVFRTDEDGAVTVTTDGQELTVAGYTGRVHRVTARTRDRVK